MDNIIDVFHWRVDFSTGGWSMPGDNVHVASCVLEFPRSLWSSEVYVCLRVTVDGKLSALTGWLFRLEDDRGLVLAFILASGHSSQQRGMFARGSRVDAKRELQRQSERKTLHRNLNIFQKLVYCKHILRIKTSQDITNRNIGWSSSGPEGIN